MSKDLFPEQTHYLEVSLGSKLKAFRLRAGLTQVQLAEAAGVFQSALARYEMDKDVPSGPRLVALAKALGATAEEITDDSLPSVAIEKHLVHGNSTAAQIQKLTQQLDSERQKMLLQHTKILMQNQESERQHSNSTPKRRTKAA